MKIVILIYCEKKIFVGTEWKSYWEREGWRENIKKILYEKLILGNIFLFVLRNFGNFRFIFLYVDL